MHAPMVPARHSFPPPAIAIDVGIANHFLRRTRRAPERRVRSRRHPRVLVGQIAELAPLPSTERLAERQAVDDMGDIRPLRVLRLLRLMRRDVEIARHAIHEDVARDAASWVVIIPVVSPRLLLLRGDASQI